MPLSLSTTVFTLKGVTVPLFNLGKYFLITYFVGLLWDIAYISAIETKRYMSLWYTGAFTVSAWGRSRNNLLSGSNFEVILSTLRDRRHALRKVAGDVPHPDEDPASDLDPLRPSIHGIWVELLLIAVTLLVVSAEALSEVYTDSVETATLGYGERQVPARARSSSVILAGAAHYSAASDLILARRCTLHRAGRDFVTRPNLVVEEGYFDEAHSIIPRYDKAVLCLHDARARANVAEVAHSRIALQRPPGRLGPRQTFSTSDVQHRRYRLQVLARVAQPHFFSAAPQAPRGPLRRRGLLLVALDGERYTCTRVHDWCVRRDGQHYEVIYPQFGGNASAPGNASAAADAFALGGAARFADAAPGAEATVVGAMPVRVPVATWPRLASDRAMMRPPRAGRMIEDMADNLAVLTIGYNFGWTTQRLERRRAIVAQETRIVPTVQLGYLVALAVIAASSAALLVLSAAVGRGRKIRGLVGEHAFIDRWHGQIAQDGAAPRTVAARTTLVATRGAGGQALLQPPVCVAAIRLSAVNEMS